jgi:hypothetical protein
VTFAANRYHRLVQQAAATPGGVIAFGMPFLRIRSGTNAAPVNQAAERVLIINARQLLA